MGDYPVQLTDEWDDTGINSRNFKTYIGLLVACICELKFSVNFVRVMRTQLFTSIYSSVSERACWMTYRELSGQSRHRCHQYGWKHRARDSRSSICPTRLAKGLANFAECGP
eukprot:4016421-Pyramimonas_sp.AAC.1